MKETIYTIPLTEALEQDSECPFCFLEQKTEQEQIAYALGPAMMEPDYRVLSNARGFCRLHTKKLASSKRALPLALVMDTRADTVLQQLEQFLLPQKKKSRFSKNESWIDRLTEVAETLSSSCLICERVYGTMDKYFEIFWYLCGKDADFRKKVLSGKGFCLHHLKDVLQALPKHAGKKQEEFAKEILEATLMNLNRAKQDNAEFIKQFDYRSNKETSTCPKDAHFILAGKLSKQFERDLI